ncbi:DUF1918 domain-containing protein [Streptomyces sp. NPDC052107]|uniref:DUF1918 domain-containing protein n=1 Tax=Streptomyces sp. NPDC052107 TaxID=3155632 RepID=UPI0034484437
MTTPAPPQRSDRVAPTTRPGASGLLMQARVGDEIVVRGATAGHVTRVDEAVGVHRPDGSPPHDVRWSDDGRGTLYFPAGGDHVRAE